MAMRPKPGLSHATAWGSEEDGLRYERGRPDYPAAAVELLAEQLGLRAGTRVVDVAAGTGKLTRRLTETAASVTAVEPMAGMRKQLRLAAPGATVVAGRAEALPIADGTVDAVTVAQAFHWFSAPEASAELRRVLRPGGRLALVNNERDLAAAAPWVRLWRVLDRYERLAPLPSSARQWRSQLERTAHFGPFERFTLPHEQRFSCLEELEDRFASVSFVILLAEEDRAALLRDVRAAVAGVDPLVVPLRTEIEVATRKA